MRNEVIISGYGGQGILFSGMFLSHLAIQKNLFTTFFPSYGAEIRGGSANCNVIVSDSEIGSPIISNPKVFIILSQPAYDKYIKTATDNSVFIINSTIVETRTTKKIIKYIYVNATEIANNIGDVKVANMILLGAYIKLIDLMNLEELVSNVKIILESKNKKMIDNNINAIEQGFKANQNNK